MARPRTHKIALQTKNLTHEEAATLMYLVTSAAAAMTGGDSSRWHAASNVPLAVLRTEFPDSSWVSSSAQARRDLV